MHVLIHLHAAQNLAQMVRQLKAESSEWLNATRLLNAPFEWEDDYSAWSVSPTVLRQVMEYFDKQEEYHRTRTLDQELEQFARLQTGQ
jgi:REP element-mobilizing transposase RayT